MLFAYGFGGFALFVGLFNLICVGYNDGALVFIMIGAFIFLLKPFMNLRAAISRIQNSRKCESRDRNNESSSHARESDFQHNPKPGRAVDEFSQNDFQHSSNSETILSKFARLESENARLKKACSDLQEQNMRLIAARSVDRDAETEIIRLSEENARLKSDLASCRNAIDALNQKLSELQK